MAQSSKKKSSSKKMSKLRPAAKQATAGKSGAPTKSAAKAPKQKDVGNTKSGKPVKATKTGKGGKLSKKVQDRVLAVHGDVSVLRLIRESLKGLASCEVDTTPDATYGFELALQREYRLFFFGLELPVLDGEQLYEFISKAYAHCHDGARTAPAVVYLSDGDASAIKPEIRSDARVKGVLNCPFEIAALLKTAEGTLTRKGSKK